MKIVVLDSYTLSSDGAGWDPLTKHADVRVYPRLADAEISQAAEGADILITNKVNVSRALIERSPSLKFIAVSATGFNCVDAVAARERKISVSNVPEYGSDSVAQFTIALLLELCHRVGLHADAVRAGEWTRSADFCFWKTPQVELAGKTIGLVGFGRIGRRVAELASSLRMKVLVNTSSRKPLDSKARWAELKDLFAESDVVSLHCPLVPATQGLINSERLGSMKSSAFLINTSRGGLVVETELAEALNSGTIAGAAVDVVSREPILAENPLLSANNCIITPHIAWTTTDARGRLLKTTVDNVVRFIEGRPANVVN